MVVVLILGSKERDDDLSGEWATSVAMEFVPSAGVAEFGLEFPAFFLSPLVPYLDLSPNLILLLLQKEYYCLFP